MRKRYFGIETAILAAKYFLELKQDDLTHTTIRCVINDILDGASKDGHRIPKVFDQDRAVRRVLRLLTQQTSEATI